MLRVNPRPSLYLFKHIDADTKQPTFTDDIFKWILLNKDIWISFKISLKFVPKGLIYNAPTLIQMIGGNQPATSRYLNQSGLVNAGIYGSLGLDKLVIEISVSYTRE